MTTPPTLASTSMSPQFGRARWRPPGRLLACWMIMAASFACYILGHVLQGSGGVTATLLGMAGAGACGWAWLIARALFDPARQDTRWPRIVVGVVVASGALAVLPLPGGLGGVIGNIYVLSGSAALLLTFVEPFHRYRHDLPVGEKRFRFAFVTVYALLVAVSILSPGPANMTPTEAYRIEILNSVCALGGLIAGTAAVWFRLRRPLGQTDPARSVRRTPTPEDRRLADQILCLLREEDVHTEPNLKVADIAARLRQPEYRISQCISAVLGFENFNRLINHHRIEQAKRLLVAPDRPQSILEIAFECGFGSVGPFNRAFKTETGVTPRDFRAAHHPASNAATP